MTADIADQPQAPDVLIPEPTLCAVVTRVARQIGAQPLPAAGFFIGVGFLAAVLLLRRR